MITSYFFELYYKIMYLIISLIFNIIVYFYYKDEFLFLLLKPYLQIIYEDAFLLTGMLDIFIINIKICIVLLISLLVILLYFYSLLFFISIIFKSTLKILLKISLLLICWIFITYITIYSNFIFILKHLFLSINYNYIYLIQYICDIRLIGYLNILYTIYLIGFIILCCIFFVWFFYIKKNLFVYINKLYLYLIISFFVLIVVPPEVILHLTICFGIIIILEIIFCLYYLKKCYQNILDK